MKAHKFHEAMRRHPYLRGLLRWGYGMTYEPKSRHIHFIAVRPLSRVPHGSFSTRRDEYGDGPREVWTESEEWTVIFRIREDIDSQRGDPNRYCALPFTEINIWSKRDFQQSGGWDRARDYGYTPDTDILEFKRLWEKGWACNPGVRGRSADQAVVRPSAHESYAGPDHHLPVASISRGSLLGYSPEGKGAPQAKAPAAHPDKFFTMRPQALSWTLHFLENSLLV